MTTKGTMNLEQAIEQATSNGPYFVVTRNREVEADPDQVNSGFSVMIADTEDQDGHALIVTASVSDDGHQAQVTVSAYSNGVQTDVQMSELFGSMMITHPI